MTVADAPEWAVKMLSEERVGRLAMLDEDDRPRVLPVTFALVDETLWSAIDRKPKSSPEPARVKRLRRRPEAALVADHYSDDWDQLAWVQALGSVEVAELAERPQAIAALTRKYPQYAAEPPPGPLLGLKIERLLSWRARA